MRKLRVVIYKLWASCADKTSGHSQEVQQHINNSSRVARGLPLKGIREYAGHEQHPPPLLLHLLSKTLRPLHSYILSSRLPTKPHRSRLLHFHKPELFTPVLIGFKFDWPSRTLVRSHCSPF